MKKHDLRTILRLYGDARAALATKNTKRLRDRLARVEQEIESRIAGLEECWAHGYAQHLFDRLMDDCRARGV